MTSRHPSPATGPFPQRTARRPALRTRAAGSPGALRTARRSAPVRSSATRRLGGRLVRLALVPLLALLVVPGAAAAPGEAAADPAAPPPPEPGVIERALTFEPVGPNDAVDAAAGAVDGRVELRFPGRKLSRTLIQWVVALTSRDVKRNDYGYYNVRLSGEVRPEGAAGSDAVDRFDFRFDLPVDDDDDGTEEPLALMFENDLRPGLYEVALEVEDLAAGTRYRALHEVEVPDLPEPSEEPAPLPATAAVPASTGGPAFVLVAAPPAGAGGAPAAATVPAPPAAPAVRLLEPRQPILIGLHRFAAVAGGAGVDRVTFLLDGKPVLTKTRPPYEVELDLGDEAQVQTLAVEAWAEGGTEPLARDETVLNTGQEPFTVRLAAPLDGAAAAGPLSARAALEVPEGQQVEAVEIYLDDELVERLAEPPFDRAVALPRPAGTAAVRAVARLRDGRRAEDTALVNAPGAVDRVDVHLVELYAAAVDGRGRQLDGLGAADFRVVEDGVEQELVRCEKVDGLPVHASLLLDVSASMFHEMDALAASALTFLQRTLTPADRASLVVFDRYPRLAVPFTGDLDRLANGLVGLRARGGTALRDGLIFALREMQGIDGQRTVVLFSDGDDKLSTTGTDEVLEFARRAGVTVHTVGLRIHPEQLEQRRLLRRLADETGGLSAFIDEVGEVDGAYRRIGELMRSRYLLAYQSSQGGGGGFRTVDVEIGRPGAQVATVRGYYP
jgi:Ca-activated chloride channel homolog